MKPRPSQAPAHTFGVQELSFLIPAKWLLSGWGTRSTLPAGWKGKMVKSVGERGQASGNVLALRKLPGIFCELPLTHWFRLCYTAVSSFTRIQKLRA